MKNVEMKMEGKTLVIKVDTTQEGTPSKSGKSLVIATTSGIVDVPKTSLKIGLNIFKVI